MRALTLAEISAVSGAGTLAGGVLGAEAKVNIANAGDSGKHIGWCRGLGNTDRSNGGGQGLDVPKHTDTGCVGCGAV